MAKDIVTRDEFESLKDAFLRLKDILSDCNLKVNANFDDIDVDDYSEIEVNGASAAGVFEIARGKLIKAIQRGRLEVEMKDNRLLVTQNLVGSYQKIPDGKLIYHPINGNARYEVDKAKGDSAKMFALFGVMSRLGASTIQTLEGVDLLLVERLSSVFLLA